MNGEEQRRGERHDIRVRRRQSSLPFAIFSQPPRQPIKKNDVQHVQDDVRGVEAR